MPFNETAALFTPLLRTRDRILLSDGLALPLSALVSLVTADSKQRLVISQIFGFFMTLGAVAVNYFSTPMMKLFGGGNMGYFWYFSIMAVVGVIMVLICFNLTKEIAHEAAPKAAKLPFKVAVPAVLKNKYWWNGMGIYLMTSPSSCWSAARIIAFTGRTTVDVGHLMAPVGRHTAGILVFIPVSRKVGKANSAAIGLAFQALGSVLLWLAPSSVAMLWISTVFRSVGVGGLSGNMNAMLADVVEYGEWKTGIRTEGMVYSGASFGGKVGAGLGGAIVAAIIDWGQYVPNAATQAPLAMTAIKFAFVGAPFIGSSLIIIMLLLFRVEKKMPQIKAELERRRNKASA